MSHQPLFSCVSGALVPRIGNCSKRTLGNTPTGVGGEGAGVTAVAPIRHAEQRSENHKRSSWTATPSTAVVYIVG